MKNTAKNSTLTTTIALILTLAITIISPLLATDNTAVMGTVTALVTTTTVSDVAPWDINRIGANLVHQQNKGTGVKIAVLDTGIDLNHPDLKVAGNISFVIGTSNGDDDNGHGTMVAGVIAALENDKGVVGIAPEAALYSVKVLDNQGNGTMETVVAGIKWAISNKMQVINMSFGTVSGFGKEEQAALQEAYNAGILIIAASGNSGDLNTIYAPARYTSVISVGAIDFQNRRAGFSGTGTELELVAPGVDIMTTTCGGKYTTASGTSIASAVVTGAAALVIASGITGNIAVRNFLDTGAKDLGSAGRDNEYGYGCVNLNGLANCLA